MDRINVGQELLNVPMGDMIRSMAMAIADAQWSLDKASMVVTELMSGSRLLRDLDSGVLLDNNGQPLSPGHEPVVIDSRVFFGKTSNDLVKAQAAAAVKSAREALIAESDANKQKPLQDALKAAETKEAEADKLPADTAEKVSMMELGFVPNFYQFVETIIEVRIAVKMSSSTDDTRRQQESRTATTQSNAAHGAGYWWHHAVASSSNATAQAASVDASYASKYNYSVDGSSFIRTKLVPIPPPAILQERIRALMEIQKRRDAAGPKN